jgi:hypothetical protein
MEAAEELMEETKIGRQEQKQNLEILRKIETIKKISRLRGKSGGLQRKSGQKRHSGIVASSEDFLGIERQNQNPNPQHRGTEVAEELKEEGEKG